MKIFRNAIKLTFSLCIILLLAKSSYAAIYKWVDEDGNLHFVNKESFIPNKYKKSAETLDFGYDDSADDDSLLYLNELEPIDFNKDESAFEGIPFGESLEDFLENNSDAQLISDKEGVKSYIIGDGNRRLADLRVKVSYSFLKGVFSTVKLAYASDEEKGVLKELTKVFGNPDFERFPFIYWLYNDLELRLRKDEDYFSIFKKKIKKF